MKVEVKFAWIDQRENYTRALVRLYLLDDSLVTAASGAATDASMSYTVPPGARTLIAEKMLEQFKPLDRNEINMLATALSSREALKRALDVIPAM